MKLVNRTIHLLLGATVAALAGCDAPSTPTPAPERAKDPVTKETLSQLPDDHPDLGALTIASRGPRRMSVAELARSLDVIGNLPPGTVQLPESITLALGQPDYLRVTEESLEPSPLFMKLMMDLGGIACTQLSDADPGRPVDQRVLGRFSDFDENARYLLLRFLGLDGADADPYVPRLRAVYDAGKAGARGDKGGWEAVCIALVTSPEFLLY